MTTGENEEEGVKKAKDKIHPPDLGETKDFEDLSFDKEKNSFEYDVKGIDEDYDHPLPYDTAAPNGEDFSSTYDESNPFMGAEYTMEKELSERLDEAGMRIDNGESIELSPEDEMLARTPEDDRDDLDEEGYPLNDVPGK